MLLMNLLPKKKLILRQFLPLYITKIQERRKKKKKERRIQRIRSKAKFSWKDIQKSFLHSPLYITAQRIQTTRSFFPLPQKKIKKKKKRTKNP